MRETKLNTTEYVPILTQRHKQSKIVSINNSTLKKKGSKNMEMFLMKRVLAY